MRGSARSFFYVLIVLGALALWIPISAHAVPMTALQFTGGSNTFSSTTRGWAFRVNTPIEITALGVWDNTPATPLGSPHEVGLWTSSGFLLAQTVVSTTGLLVDDFRYELLATPLTLAAGDFHLGALMAGDPYQTSVSSITTLPEITYLGGRDDGTFSSVLTFPNTNFANNRAFGPNMLIQAPPVPEPTTLALMGLGLAGIGYRRRQLMKA